MDNNWKFHGSLMEYEILFQDGQYFIRYRDEKLKNGNFLPLISERDQQREAFRILGGFKLQKGLLAVVMGAAGISLLQILVEEKKRSGGNIIVFEADTDLYSFLKEKLPELFNNVEVFTPVNISKFLEYIGETDIEQMMGYRILPHPRCMQLDSEFYQRIQHLFKTNFSTRFSDLLTRIEFESKWILNSFLNIPGLSRAIPVKNLFNTANGQAGLIVSSGPSLRQSLEWIKVNQNNFFICCVDSAYRVLMRSGITPHLIFTLDSQIYTYRHFQGLPRGEKGKFPVLYADFVSNPWVLRQWQGDLIMGLTAHYSETHRVITPGCDYIEDEFLKEPCGDIQSGGSVATSIFDLFRNMNFKSISLVGQDLGFTNREIHCTGTHHTDIWQSGNINRLESFENINNKVLKKRHIVWGVSIQGKPLPEDFIFSMYKKWFEESIAKVPMMVFNETFDGSKISCITRNSLNYNSVSPGFFDKFESQVFTASNRIINNEGVLPLLKKILSYEPDNNPFPENMRFLNRIGKKYFIKFLRCKLKETETENRNCDMYLRYQNKEQMIFWRYFLKSMKNIINKINPVV
jgi:hypothetical protein